MSNSSPHRTDLEGLEKLHVGAATPDGVIYTAFIHHLSKYAANIRDR
jgi:hypothetical protein